MVFKVMDNYIWLNNWENFKSKEALSNFEAQSFIDLTNLKALWGQGSVDFKNR